MKQTGEGKFEALLDELRSDRRFAAIVKNYEAAQKGAKKFGSNGLKV